MSLTIRNGTLLEYILVHIVANVNRLVWLILYFEDQKFVTKGHIADLKISFALNL